MSIIGKKAVGLEDFPVTVASGVSCITGPYIAGEDGAIDSISVYTTTTGISLKMGVYLQDENHATFPRPTTLVADNNSSPIAVTQAGWQTANKSNGSGVIEKGKRYWIGFIASGDAIYKLNYTEEKWWWLQSGPYSTGMRGPFLTGGGSTLYRAISAYFTYTPTAPDIGDTTLQARINRATPGSTVKIRYGFYNERLIINKPLKLVGVRDRRGRLPIIQGGTLLTGWTQSTAPEHTGKNVWYKDVSINGKLATWVRSLQLDEKGVQILQYHPLLAGEGVDEATATTLRNTLLTCGLSELLPSISANPTQTIVFWDWYDAIACHERIDSTVGRLWLRFKDVTTNPNDSVCYVTLTQNTRSTDVFDRNYTNDLASVVSCHSQEDVTIRNLEVRGGRWGIDVQNSSNILIEKCRVLTPSLRSINVSDCTDVTIQKNEITSNWMRANIGMGFGGTSDRAKAGMWGWALNKNYSTSGAPAPNGHSVQLAGVTSNVTIRRNWMHNQGGGIGWGYGSDNFKVDAVIENNRFETMDSAGIVIYTKATGLVRNNVFSEVHLNFRIQDMMNQIQPDSLVTIENNYIHSVEASGYVLQAHYAGTHTIYEWTSPIIFKDNFVRNVAVLIANLLTTANVRMDGNVIDTDGFASANLAANGMIHITNEVQTITFTGGPTGGTVTLTFDGNSTSALAHNVTAANMQTALNALPGLTSTTGMRVVRTGSGTASAPYVYEIRFAGTAVQSTNVPQITSSNTFTGGTSPTVAHATLIEGVPPVASAFANNWIGGSNDAYAAAPWWGSGNDYTLNQRLPVEALPAPPLPILPGGFEEVGPYRQNVGVPILRSDKTYGERFSG